MQALRRAWIGSSLATRSGVIRTDSEWVIRPLMICPSCRSSLNTTYRTRPRAPTPQSDCRICCNRTLLQCADRRHGFDGQGGGEDTTLESRRAIHRSRPPHSDTFASWFKTWTLIVPPAASNASALSVACPCGQRRRPRCSCRRTLYCSLAASRLKVAATRQRTTQLAEDYGYQRPHQTFKKGVQGFVAPRERGVSATVTVFARTGARLFFQLMTRRGEPLD